MGIQQDIEQSLKGHHVDRIEGQPTEDAITRLVQQLSAMGASVPTSLGDGNHGHAGVILSQAEYHLLTGSPIDFIAPTNPPFPATLNNDAAIRAREIALYNEDKKTFETWTGICNVMRMKITDNIDEEWLEPIKHRTLGFYHKTPLEMIEHLENIGADLDDMDITELSSKMHEAWDPTEHPATWFARLDKYEKQLEKAGVQRQPTLRLALAKASFRKAGEYNEAIARFEAKAVTQQTFDVFKTHMTKEFATHSKQNKASAKSVQFGIANKVHEEDASRLTDDNKALIDIINALQGAKKPDDNDKRFEDFMKATTDTLKALTDKMAKMGHSNNSNSSNHSGGGKKMRCKHCNLNHPRVAEKDCWTLESNKDKRPNWYKPKDRKEE